MRCAVKCGAVRVCVACVLRARVCCVRVPSVRAGVLRVWSAVGLSGNMHAVASAAAVAHLFHSLCTLCRTTDTVTTKTLKGRMD